jgi:glycosyltransferase involved in cell wall biosynthesis/predicted O-methyltransferase YrrM
MSSTPVRVCLIAPEFIGPFPNGGVGTACYWEATTLAQAGFDVTVLYTGPTERATAAHWEATYGAGPFRYVDLWRWAADGPTRDVADVRHPCAESQTAELVSRFLSTRTFDLLLFQEFLGHGFRALQARLSGHASAPGTAAVTLHSCRQWIYEGMRRLPSSREDLLVDVLERESARLADAVVAPSRHMAEWASSHWRLDEAPRVVPYCYDIGLQRPASVVEHCGPFTHLVFFGRLETRKGLHLLCRALAQHREARGPLKTVTFLGKGSSVEGQPSDEFIRATLGDVAGLDLRIINTFGSLEALDWLEAQQQALVVAPSLVDNLPYALIELYARRLPLLSTRIGGIPEIVGASNAHALAEPTVDALAELIAGVHAAGRLTLDYRDGYQIDAANEAHIDWARSLVRAPHAGQARRTTVAMPGVRRACDVVVVDAPATALPQIRRDFLAADATAQGASFMTWTDWRVSDPARPTLFISRTVVPERGLVARLAAVLDHPRAAAATTYYRAVTPMGAEALAPLGGSLEAGWTTNVFGGPCVMASGDALRVLGRRTMKTFAFWPAYVALALAEADLAVVPEVLYASAPPAASVDEIETLAALYREHGAARCDIGWILKYAHARDGAVAGTSSSGSAGRALYDALTNLPDASLQAFAGLSWCADDDSYMRDLRHLRRRLTDLARSWDTTQPRVFVYGAGQHARLVLTLEPELGRHVAGFIDKRPIAEFLGKPCVRPDQVRASELDIVLYSSREYEREMHAYLAHVPVQHVLLYAESPAEPEPTTALRLRRRLGHSPAPVDDLRAMYHPPEWVRGGCSHGDVEFLLEMVTAVEPRIVLELGVASGTSSAALLFALDRLPADGAPRLLYSGDVRSTCYFDPSRATGAAVAELYPSRRSIWTLDTDTDARRVRHVLAEGSVDLCFIDANHSHPWPLLDVLHVAPLLKPRGWIMLHDIELPRLHPQFQVHGPKWLFEAWPFNKIHGVGSSINIGAVQLPDRLSDLVPVAHALLDRAWEHAPTDWDVDLPEVFADITPVVAARLVPQPALAG